MKRLILVSGEGLAQIHDLGMPVEYLRLEANDEPATISIEGWGVLPYFLVSVSPAQAEAMAGTKIAHEDVTPTALRQTNGARKGLWCRGGFIPDGTQLRRRYGGKDYAARVRGAVIEMDGRAFQSPTEAARAVSGIYHINGWAFWEYLEGDAWKPLTELRR